MPPKKKRAKANSSNQGAQNTQRQTRSASRESSIEPSRQIRSGRKRQHSDVSHTSENSLDTTSPMPMPGKRRKREDPIAVAEAEYERLQDVMEGQEEEEIDDTAEGPTDSVQTAKDRHVHFYAGAGTTEDGQSSDDLNAMSSPVGAKASKMIVKRRKTASPTVTAKGGDRQLKRMSIRRSLPPSLALQGEAQTRYIEERKFAPLSAVLHERKQQRRVQRSRMEALNNELASARSANDAVRIKALEDDLGVVKQQLALSLISVDEDDATTLDDMLVLASQEELQYPEITPEQSERSLLRLSHGRSQDDIAALERKHFEDAVLIFSEQASQAKAMLEILQIQIHGLGFASDEENAVSVLQAVRSSFDGVRDSLKDVLLDAVPQQASNEDLLGWLVDLLKEYASQLRDQDQELENRSLLDAELGKQVQGLVNRLADSESRDEEMKLKFGALDAANDEKARQIEKLQADIDAVSDERDVLKEDLESRTGDLSGAREDNIELAKNIDILTASLQRYREEESRLVQLISKMEEEHETGISKMNREREETVRDLEERLDEEIRCRVEKEEQNLGQQASMTALELQIEEAESEQNRLLDELAEIRSLHDGEKAARDEAEVELRARVEEVAELEQRVSQLEDDLDQLNSELGSLRQAGEAERDQREAAESRLEEANAELLELDQKLQTQGIESNQLRQKLFEVQQQNERKIRDLEETWSGRDQQYQQDFAEEVARREAADVLAEERFASIETLQINLEGAEEAGRKLLAERDQRLQELEQQLADAQDEMDCVSSELENARSLHSAETEEAQTQRHELESSIASLQETIEQNEAQMELLRKETITLTENYEMELGDRDANTAELNDTIARSELQIAELEREKSGLERRVEQEAEQMLEFQNEKQDEIDGLTATIRDKQAKIKIVEEKAIAADERWQEFVNARDEDIAARDEEIGELRTTVEETTQTMANVTADAEVVRRKFREYVVKTSGKMRSLREANAALKMQLERDGAELEEEGAEVLEQVDALSVFHDRTIVSSQQVQEFPTRNTRGRKKRVVDSGIGLEEGMLED